MIAFKLTRKSHISMLYNLQTLRALAALSVVAVHVRPLAGSSIHLNLIGIDGVEVFFVLSGFLMAFILDGNSKRFLIRRLIRIIPAYWLFTTITFISCWLLPAHFKSSSTDIGSLLKSLLFIPYQKESGLIRPLLFLGWTLNYEMYFYVVLAFWEWLAGPVRAAVVSALQLVMVMSVIRLLEIDSTLARFYSADYILDFIFGIAVHRLWKWTDAIGWTISPYLMGLGFALPLALSLLSDVIPGYGSLPQSLSKGIPAAVLVLTAVLAERRGIVSKDSRIMMVGDASYVLYLSHPFVINGIDLLFNPRWVPDVLLRLFRFPLLIVGAVGVAVAIHLWIEKPLISRVRLSIEGNRQLN